MVSVPPELQGNHVSYNPMQIISVQNHKFDRHDNAEEKQYTFSI